MKLKLFLPLAIAAGVFVAFGVALVRNAQGDDPKKLESVLVGKPVPAFEGENLLASLQANQPERISQALLQDGKPHLFNVWATWCPTCYAEHQFLNKLQREGVNIIGVDYKDDREKAQNWLKELGNPYQAVVFDPKGSLGLDLGVYGAPETFVVDGQGKILYRHTGDLNETVWAQTIKPIYQQAAAAR